MEIKLGRQCIRVSKRTHQPCPPLTWSPCISPWQTAGHVELQRGRSGVAPVCRASAPPGNIPLPPPSTVPGGREDNAVRKRQTDVKKIFFNYLFKKIKTKSTKRTLIFGLLSPNGCGVGNSILQTRQQSHQTQKRTCYQKNPTEAQTSLHLF